MDITKRVTHIFRHDTSQAEAAMKRLRGVERDRAKTMLDDLNAQNSKLEASIATWGKIGVAVGGAVAIYKTLQSTSKAYLEDLRLESAARGANIDRLREATQGLVETDALLAFAGKTQNAIWKLSQAEMETVLQGINAIRVKTGAELTPTMEKLTESLMKGSSRALKEFGIEAKSKTELLAVMERQVESLGGKTSLAGDEFERAGVQWADAVDDLQGAMGRLAIQLAPVISGLADVVGFVGEAIKGFADWDAQLQSWSNDFFVWMDETLGFDTDRVRAARGGGATGERSRLWELSRGHRGPSGTLAQAEAAAREGTGQDLVDKLLAEMRGRASLSQQQVPSWVTVGPARMPDLDVPAKLKVKSIDVDPDALAQELSRIYGAASRVLGTVADFAKDPARRGWEDIGAEAEKNRAALESIEGISRGADAAAAIAEANARIFETTRGRTMLEAIFGTPTEIDLTMTSLQQLGQGFNVVSGAAGAAMDAWITGQKSMGQAFNEAIVEGLRGLAVQATVEALKHTAFGVGALAFGPIMGATAAAHFQAAAMFGGVAVAAGVGARSLGGATGQFRSSGPAGGSAVAGGSGGSSAPAAPQERHVVLMLGRDFLALPDLEQRDLTYRAIKQASNIGATTSTIRRS